MMSSPASAQNVKVALAHYQALEFEKVIPKLKQALADPTLTVEDRILALAYLGRTRAIFRRPQAAHKAFVRLLELAPEYNLEEYESPLIHEAFASAKTRWQKLAQRRERPASISTEGGAIKQEGGAIKQEGEAIKQEGEAIKQEGGTIKQEGGTIKQNGGSGTQESVSSTPAEARDQKALISPPNNPMAEPPPPRPEVKTVGSQTTLWVVLGASVAVLAAGSITLAVTRPWEGDSKTSLGTLELP